MDKQTADKPEVRLADETMAYLHSQMKAAVSDGIREALTPEAARAFARAALEEVREQATVHTGRFILDGIRAAFKRLLWVAVFLGAMYWVGGWSLFVTVWKAVASSKGAP